MKPQSRVSLPPIFCSLTLEISFPFVTGAPCSSGLGEELEILFSISTLASPKTDSQKLDVSSACAWLLVIRSIALGHQLSHILSSSSQPPQVDADKMTSAYRLETTMGR